MKSEYLSIRNPLNVPERYVRRGEVFRQWIQALVNDENLDVIGLRLRLPRWREDEDVIARFRDLGRDSGSDGKLILLFSRASIRLPEYWRRLLVENKIPFLLEYRRGFKALKALIDYERFVNSERRAGGGKDRGRAGRFLSSGEKLTERQAKEILAEYGIPITREGAGSKRGRGRGIGQIHRLSPGAQNRVRRHNAQDGGRGVKIGIHDEAALRCGYHEFAQRTGVSAERRDRRSAGAGNDFTAVGK